MAYEPVRSGHRRASAPQAFDLAVGEAVAQRALGRPVELAETVRAVIAAARRMSVSERGGMGVAYPAGLGRVGRRASMALERSLAQACFMAELTASPRDRFGLQRNVAFADLAMLAVLGGEMRRADRLLAEIVDADWDLPQLEVSAKVSYAIAFASLAFNRGDIATGVRVVEDLAAEVGPHSESWALIAVTRSAGYLLEGESQVALRELMAADAAARGSSTVMLMAIRAMRAALGGRLTAADRLLARAARFATSPAQTLWVALAGVVIARRDPSALAAAAEGLARTVVEHGLVWPLTILTEEDRAEIVAVLVGTDLGPAMRLAFDRIPAATRLAPDFIELSPRELAVLRDLAETSSRAELAARAMVSVNTIKTQLSSIYRKLEVSDRRAALARAVELGLIDRDGS